jgi:large subunit ribosomal protein L21
MKIAVIKTGGKEYLVASQNKLKIEKLSAETGKALEFDQVLLVADENGVKVGKPLVAGAKVMAKVLKQERLARVEVVKYKNKIRYKRVKGHRQPFTEVMVEKID